MKEIRNEIGKQIFDLRTKNELSQEALARRAEVSSRTVANIEAGAFAVRVDTLQKIANSLDSDVKIVERKKKR